MPKVWSGLTQAAATTSINGAKLVVGESTQETSATVGCGEPGGLAAGDNPCVGAWYLTCCRHRYI